MIFGKDMSTLRKLMLLKAATEGAPLNEYEASGNPLTFNTNKAKPLRSVLASWLPHQSGTGDPSPQNVRPVLGMDGVTVWHGGKNLFGTTFVSGNVSANEGTITKSDYTTNRILCDDFVELMPGTYTISCKEGKQSTIYFYKTADVSSYVYSERLASWTNNPRSFTLTEKRYALIVLRNSDNSNLTPSDVTEFQLELGSTATSYEPYSGTSYSVAFPVSVGTVYGGTLDLTTGVLTAEWAKVTIGSGISLTFDNYAVPRANIPLESNHFPPAELVNTRQLPIMSYCISDVLSSTWHGYISNQMVLVRFDVNIATSKSEAEAYFAEHPLEVAYKLETPVTYQLTPQQITALIGNNTMWADADDLSVTYLKKG